MIESVAVPALGRSIVRTVVPYVVGLLLLLLAKHAPWLPLDEESLTPIVEQGVVIAVGALWYVMVRLFERARPKLGWLLGAPGAPLYEKDVRELRGERAVDLNYRVPSSEQDDIRE